MNGLRVARGFGFGSISASAADLNLRESSAPPRNKEHAWESDPTRLAAPPVLSESHCTGFYPSWEFQLEGALGVPSLGTAGEKPAQSQRKRLRKFFASE